MKDRIESIALPWGLMVTGALGVAGFERLNNLRYPQGTAWVLLVLAAIVLAGLATAILLRKRTLVTMRRKLRTALRHVTTSSLLALACVFLIGCADSEGRSFNTAGYPRGWRQSSVLTATRATVRDAGCQPYDCTVTRGGFDPQATCRALCPGDPNPCADR